MLKVNFKRLISYHFRKFLFSRINYKNDPNFPGMDLLRKNGAIYLPKFSQNNLLSKQIIDSFESQKEIILSKEILKLDNKKGRYDYRSKITNYFDKDLLLSYAKQNFFIQFIKPTIIALEVPKPVDVGTVENIEICNFSCKSKYLIVSLIRECLI